MKIWNFRTIIGKKNNQFEQPVLRVKGLNNFWNQTYFACIVTIKIPIGTNNLDVENYKNKSDEVLGTIATYLHNIYVI